MTETKNLITDAYEELCSEENLEIAFNRARTGKTLKPYIIEFTKNYKEKHQLLPPLVSKN